MLTGNACKNSEMKLKGNYSDQARCLSLQILLFLPCKICVINTYFISVQSSGHVSAVSCGLVFYSVWFSIVIKHHSCTVQCIMARICQQKCHTPTSCVLLFAPELVCSWVTKYPFFIILASVFFHKPLHFGLQGGQLTNA